MYLERKTKHKPYASYIYFNVEWSRNKSCNIWSASLCSPSARVRVFFWSSKICTGWEYNPSSKSRRKATVGLSYSNFSSTCKWYTWCGSFSSNKKGSSTKVEGGCLSFICLWLYTSYVFIIFTFIFKLSIFTNLKFLVIAFLDFLFTKWLIWHNTKIVLSVRLYVFFFSFCSPFPPFWTKIGSHWNSERS